MRIVLIIIIIFLSRLPAVASLSGNWAIKGGINYSTPVNEKNYESKPGLNLAVGRNFNLYKKFILYTGAQYDKRNFVLKNRVIFPYYMGHNTADAYSWDIKVKVSFIEIPVIVKYKMAIGNNIILSPNLGVTYQIPYEDNSSVTKKSYQFTVNKPPDPALHFDNHFSQETVFDIDDNNILYNIGLEFIWKSLFLDFQYAFDPNNNLDVINLSIPLNGEMHVYRIWIGLNFWVVSKVL